MRFLDLLSAAPPGWPIFADVPRRTTLLRGVVICTATLWVARREHHRAVLAGESGP